MSKAVVLLGFTGLIIFLFAYMASFDSNAGPNKSKKSKKTRKK